MFYGLLNAITLLLNMCSLISTDDTLFRKTYFASKISIRVIDIFTWAPMSHPLPSPLSQFASLSPLPTPLLYHDSPVSRVYDHSSTKIYGFSHLGGKTKTKFRPVALVGGPRLPSPHHGCATISHQKPPSATLALLNIFHETKILNPLPGILYLPLLPFQ